MTTTVNVFRPPLVGGYLSTFSFPGQLYQTYRHFLSYQNFPIWFSKPNNKPDRLEIFDSRTVDLKTKEDTGYLGQGQDTSCGLVSPQARGCLKKICQRQLPSPHTAESVLLFETISPNWGTPPLHYPRYAPPPGSISSSTFGNEPTTTTTTATSLRQTPSPSPFTVCACTCPSVGLLFVLFVLIHHHRCRPFRAFSFHSIIKPTTSTYTQQQQQQQQSRFHFTTKCHDMRLIVNGSCFVFVAFVMLCSLMETYEWNS
ncbi:conserved hypothetical protein [Trichinella spiralis]|uniref:hypothetical protein n=1 Tax=Trichinella spiralis TaxID=6334 RepID=UPI0001EFBE07|nr:conserved hypothetical protein [Trichinella spiralis]